MGAPGTQWGGTVGALAVLAAASRGMEQVPAVPSASAPLLVRRGHDAVDPGRVRGDAGVDGRFLVVATNTGAGCDHPFGHPLADQGATGVSLQDQSSSAWPRVCWTPQPVSHPSFLPAGSCELLCSGQHRAPSPWGRCPLLLRSPLPLPGSGHCPLLPPPSPPGVRPCFRGGCAVPCRCPSCGSRCTSCSR